MINTLIYDHNSHNKIDKIFHDVEQSANIFVVKLNIYNPMADATLQKFWIKINKAKLQKKNKNNARIAIFNKDVNLVTCMESLDKKINELVKKINPNIEEYSSSLELNDSYSPVINLEIDNETITFNSNNEPVNFYEIANGRHVSILIELESVKIYDKFETKIWRIKQIKENNLIDLTVSLFESSSTSAPVNVLNTQHQPVLFIPPPPPPPPLQSHIITKVLKPIGDAISSKNNTPLPSSRENIRPPTAVELVFALQKLKKVSDTKQEKNTNPIIVNKDIHVTDLKKVTTKEPLSMVDIMKKECIDKRIKDRIKYVCENLPLMKIGACQSMLEEYEKSLKNDKLHRKYTKLFNRAKRIKLFNE